MEYYIHTVIMVIAEIYCSMLLFQFFAEKRNEMGRGKVFGIIFIQGLVGLILSYALINHFYIRIACVIAEFSVAMFLIYQVRFVKAMVLSILFVGMGFIAECVTLIFLGWMFPLATGRSVDFAEAFSLNTMAVISKLLLFAIVLFIGKILGRKESDVLGGREWGILFVISLITIFSLALMVLNIDLMNHPEQGNLMYIIIGMLAINFIVYYLIRDIMKREITLREYAVFQEKAKNETAMYHSLSDNLEKQRQRTHEYKNQIAAINALVTGERYQELEKYIGEIDSALKERMNAIDTNNVIVNAILNTKYQEAVSRGIVVVLKVNDLSGLNMREEDIVVILSNLLNNAMEACTGCEDKVIRVKFVIQGGQAVISVRNSMAEEPVVENGKFVSTKDGGAAERGMGIRNIVETIERYGGRYMIDYNGGEFQFSILIPVPILQ